MPTFRHDMLPFAYADTGTGTPFVFQHGLGGDARQSASQTPAGVRLIALDCRGHGRTPLGPKEALGFRTFALDLDALLGHLQVHQVILGGVSMGAGVALSYASLLPHRVRAMILVRPAWIDRGWTPNLRVFSEIAELLRRDGSAVGKQRFAAESLAYRKAVATSPAIARSLLSQFDRPHATEHVAVLERMPRDCPVPSSDSWEGLGMPTLVLGAPLDPVHPYSYAEWLQNRLPNATLRKVPPRDKDSEHREAIGRAIQDFTASLGEAPALAPRSWK